MTYPTGGSALRNPSISSAGSNKTVRAASSNHKPDNDEMRRLLAEVSNRDEAKSILEKREYAEQGHEYTVMSLSVMLLQLTTSMGASTAQVAKAIAIMINCTALDLQVTQITNTIMEKISAPITQLSTSTDQLSSAAECIIQQAGQLASNAQNIELACSALREEGQKAMEEISVAAEGLKPPQGQPGPAANSMVNSPRAQLSSLEFPPLPANQATTYVNTTRLPASHAAVVARSEQKRRQLLIRTAEGMPNQDLDKLSHDDILHKANLALEALGKSRSDVPTGAAFLGAIILQRGDVILEANSIDVADWLRLTEVRIWSPVGDSRQGTHLGHRKCASLIRNEH